MSNTPILCINKFSIDKIQEGASVLIIGQRGSGKSWLIKHILDTKGWTGVATAISPTDRMNPFYSFHGINVHSAVPDTWSDEIKANPDQHKVAILDDCVASKHITAYNELIRSTKQPNMTLIVTTKKALNLAPDIRANFDYVFVFRENRPSKDVKIKRIWDYYAGSFPTLASFKKVLATTTEGYRTMVIDVQAQDRKVCWYGYATAVNLVIAVAPDEIPQEPVIVPADDATPEPVIDGTTDATPDTAVDGSYSCSLL